MSPRRLLRSRPPPRPFPPGVAREIVVEANGGFGSVNVVTSAEVAADAAEEAAEDAEDARDG